MASLLKKSYQDGLKDGAKLRDAIFIQKMRNLICFDHLAGSCDHAACYQLSDLIRSIESGRL